MIGDTLCRGSVQYIYIYMLKNYLFAQKHSSQSRPHGGVMLLETPGERTGAVLLDFSETSADFRQVHVVLFCWPLRSESYCPFQ